MEEKLNEKTDNTLNWPDRAIGLYERLTGRRAEITHESDNMEAAVPSNAAEDASYANWKLNGILKTKTRNTKS